MQLFSSPILVGYVDLDPLSLEQMRDHLNQTNSKLCLEHYSLPMKTPPFSQPTKMLSPLIDEAHRDLTLEPPTTYLSITFILESEILFHHIRRQPRFYRLLLSGPTSPSRTLARASNLTLFCFPSLGFQTIAASSIATTTPSAVNMERITVLICLMTYELIAGGVHSLCTH